MALPSIAIITATVVGRDNERRLASIFIQLLAGFPKLSDVLIGAVGSIQILVIPTIVCPVVCLAEGNVQNARPLDLQIF